MYERTEEPQLNIFERFLSFLGVIGSFIFGTVEGLVTAVAICVVLYLFILTPHVVDGKSMYPTYENGEFLLANKIVYNFQAPKQGDVIIFKHSETADYIKRIIGLPGDTVTLRDGRLYVNGELLEESSYLDASVVTNGGSALSEGQTVTVPDGEYFVCGDNRPHSSDSREFGPIKRSAIKGKVWVVYFPFQNFRFVKHPNYR